jgi:hypothetical protein
MKINILITLYLASHQWTWMSSNHGTKPGWEISSMPPRQDREGLNIYADSFTSLINVVSQDISLIFFILLVTFLINATNSMHHPL